LDYVIRLVWYGIPVWHVTKHGIPVCHTHAVALGANFETRHPLGDSHDAVIWRERHGRRAECETQVIMAEFGGHGTRITGLGHHWIHFECVDCACRSYGEKTAELGWREAGICRCFWSGELPLLPWNGGVCATHGIGNGRSVPCRCGGWLNDGRIRAAIAINLLIIRLELSLLLDRTVTRKGRRFCF
jgi:hypothetical protein